MAYNLDPTTVNRVVVGTKRYQRVSFGTKLSGFANNSEKSEQFGNIGFELDRKFDVNYRNKMGTEI